MIELGKVSIHRISRHVLLLALLGVCIVCIVLMALVGSVRTIPEQDVVPADSAPAVIPSPVVFTDVDWKIVRDPGVPSQVDVETALGERFRLAGTFFAFGDDESLPIEAGHRAILDDLPARRQHLVREGDQVGAIQVVAIERESIVLRDHRGEEELFLSFTEFELQDRPYEVAEAEAVEESDVPLRFEDMPTLEENRFGRRIGEERWIMQRDALMEYADELQEDPERLTALLMAMQPDLDESDEIQGFVLDMLGENELYEAAGFQDGDVVRMVNSMPMISPRRAEYFIGEFLRGNLNAVVFEIERDGEDHRLIHLIR